MNEGLSNEKGIFEADKDRLLKEKNMLIDKRDKLKEQLAVIKPDKEPKVKLKKGGLKVKRLLSFDNIKGIL